MQDLHHSRLTFKGLCLGATAALVLGAFATASSAEAQQRLAMGATHSNSSFYSYQVAVVSDWNDAIENIDMSVNELGGASASTEALLRGEVDMGIAVTSSDFSAVDEGADQMRTLYFFAPLPLNWIVNANSDIENLEGIAGHDFNPGGRGSATEKQTGSIVELLDLGIDLYRAGGDDALEAYQNRRIAGFVKAGIHPDGYIQQAHSSQPIRMLSMTDEQTEAVVEEYPYFSVGNVDPGDYYGEQGGPKTTVQTAIGINTTADLSEEIAYEIVKRRFSEDGMAAAKSGYEPADRSNPVELTLEAAVAPLHAGVVRYYEEQGIEVPEDLIPPEYNN